MLYAVMGYAVYTHRAAAPIRGLSSLCVIRVSGVSATICRKSAACGCRFQVCTCCCHRLVSAITLLEGKRGWLMQC